jgi:hypothetical protein
MRRFRTERGPETTFDFGHFLLLISVLVAVAQFRNCERCL